MQILQHRCIVIFALAVFYLKKDWPCRGFPKLSFVCEFLVCILFALDFMGGYG